MENGAVTRPRRTGQGWVGGGRAFDLIVVAAAVALGGMAAWWAFPSWDDGVLWLDALEGGAAAVARNQPDRPVVGALWAALARHGLLWIGAAVTYLGTWFLTGVVTMTLWRRTFPEWKNYAVAAALIAVAPVALETQTVAVNPIFTAHAQVALVYASQLWLWRPDGRRAWWRVAAAGAVVLAMALITEYAVMATVMAAGASWLLGRLQHQREAMREAMPEVTNEPQSSPGPRKKNERNALLATMALAVLGYGIYHVLGNAEARPEIRPERQLAALGLLHLLEIPLRLPFTLYTGVIGEFLKDLGEVNFSRATAAGLPVGALFAAAVVLRVRRTRAPATAETPQPEVPAWQRALALVVPLVLGLCVVIAMSSSIRGNVASRLWLSMIPVVGCLTLFVLLTVVRARFHLLVVGLAVFMAGYLEANAARGARLADRELTRLGATMRAELAPTGLTVAMFTNFPTNHAVGDAVPRPYELISHMTRGWTAGERQRFWAGAFPWQPIHDSVEGLGGICGPAQAIHSETGRGWNQHGAIAKMLWVSFDADGKSYVETAAPRH
jgi:hypothetical protein